MPNSKLASKVTNKEANNHVVSDEDIRLNHTTNSSLA